MTAQLAELHAVAEQLLIDETERKMRLPPTHAEAFDFSDIELRLAAQLGPSNLAANWSRGAGKTAAMQHVADIYAKLKEFAAKSCAPILLTAQEAQRCTNRPPMDARTYAAVVTAALHGDTRVKACDTALTITGRKTNNRPALQFFVPKGGT